MFLRQTRQQLRQYLIDINIMSDSDYSLLQVYKWFVVKEKAIYTQLNMLKQGEKLLIGLFWCPAKMKQQLDMQLNKIRNERTINVP